MAYWLMKNGLPNYPDWTTSGGRLNRFYGVETPNTPTAMPAQNWFDIYHPAPSWATGPTAPTNPPLAGGTGPGLPPNIPAGGIPGTPGSANPTGAPVNPPAGGAGGIPGYSAPNTQLSSVIQNLLNPDDAQANYDVTLHGAERSIAGGIPGSGLGAETTGRMRQADIERRAKLGSEMLFGQENLDLKNKIESGHLSLEQARLALQDRIQSGQLSVENARLILDWYRALNPQSGGGGNGNNNHGGGGGGTGAVPPSSNGQPSWRYGSGLPPLPDPSDTLPPPGWNPPWTQTPYTTPGSPYYADPGQGYDYNPNYNLPGQDLDYWDQGNSDLFSDSDYYSYA